jgi:hypothetical protein
LHGLGRPKCRYRAKQTQKFFQHLNPHLLTDIVTPFHAVTRFHAEFGHQ